MMHNMGCSEPCIISPHVTDILFMSNVSRIRKRCRWIFLSAVGDHDGFGRAGVSLNLPKVVKRGF